MSKKVLIVGGVAGGASAAARLRRLDEEAEIILFEKDEHISFANCGLPYYIGETILERSKLLVQTPEAMKKRFNIDVRVFSEVIKVSPENKSVTVRSDKGEYEENYDYLVLSPGAHPIKPPFPGLEDKRIFTLRNIADTDKIKEAVDNAKGTSAVVIGGGYIGVEMAENLIHRGMKVTLVEAAPHVLAPLDSDMSILVEKELEANGVSLVLNTPVQGFRSEEEHIVTMLSEGMELKSQLVIMAIGVTPSTDFLKDSGIVLGQRGHILTNGNMETNIPGIFAVGDAVEIVDFVNGSSSAIPLAGPANKQGRIAADNIAGIPTTYKGTQGTSIIKVFKLTAAGTGNNERTLKRMNIPYKAITIHPMSHASYYPGAIPMTLKLLFNEEGRILGAQGVGSDGVDKRIDVLATVIRLKGTVEDLTELELAYAPPYASAKDPVNMLGYVAQNVLKNGEEVFTVEDLKFRDTEKTLLVDVRTPEEYENGKIEGAINIPVDDLRQRLGEINKDKEVWINCQVGLRGYIASRILKANGFKVKNMTGGYKSYASSRFVPKPVDEKAGSGDNDKEGGSGQRPCEMMPCGYEKPIDKPTKTLDASGLCCPGPLMSVKGALETLNEGEILEVRATDPGFVEDIKAWCRKTGNELLSLDSSKAEIIATIKKGGEVSISKAADEVKDNKTMVVFSGDLDKAIASFIIANGAASMGKKVTMFFTFWGLNILRREEKVSVKKGFMDRMFGAMMPRGSKKLQLSKMNMMGMGPKMIRKVMKDKNISSLEDLIKAAIASGIEIVACQMSMDVMGIAKEELIDGVKIGGVGYYLGEAEDSNVNLFI